MQAPIEQTRYIYYNNTRIKRYNATLKAFCTKQNVPFLSMFNVAQVSDLPDGLHPDAEGHQKMFERIKTFVLPFLTDAS